MDAQISRELVLRAWREFATQDPDRIAAVFTLDAEWLAPPENPTARALDGTNHLIGRDRIVRFLTIEFPAVFVADRKVDFTAVTAEGTTVVVEERMRATLMNGNHYDNEYCFVFELSDDGLIHRVREYMDTRRAEEMFATPSPNASGQPSS
ncbi:nuclear transport factor 2 family protein [Nocardia sp. NBC_00508]|uniref:nuclear transport factor 2 family protein n=1 Tax=Nocardia sp. NBC_00508 TaxID=2975992 RepID=UPI002E80C738|nr:nuclear transport factor 2 family protein [Nocardia sp. NBC_00508]WUD64034.1 nuclear transport factor 2 family protein [Nocardia sp. NBC_00508]